MVGVGRSRRSIRALAAAALAWCVLCGRPAVSAAEGLEVAPTPVYDGTPVLLGPRMHTLLSWDDPAFEGRGDPDVFGFAEVTLTHLVSDPLFCAQATVRGDMPTGFELRRGRRGENGPVVLTGPYPTMLCAPVARSLANEILGDPGGFHLVITTATRPWGAVRGQLDDTEVDTVSALLSGREVVPPNRTKQYATFELTASTTVLCWSVTTHGDETPSLDDLIIRRAAPGGTGPAIARLTSGYIDPDESQQFGCTRMDDTFAAIMASPSEHAIEAELWGTSTVLWRAQLSRSAVGRTGPWVGGWDADRSLTMTAVASPTRLCLELATIGSAAPTQVRVLRDLGAGQPPAVVSNLLAAGLLWPTPGPKGRSGTLGCVALAPLDGHGLLSGSLTMRVEVVAAPVGGGAATAASIPIVIRGTV